MLSKCEHIRQEILLALQQGRWQLGDRLPALPALAEEFGASNWSVEEALKSLIREGVLTRQPKKGTYVQRVGPDPNEENWSIAVAGVDPREWMVPSYYGPLMEALGNELGERVWLLVGYREVESLAAQFPSLRVPALLAVAPTAAQIPVLDRLAEGGLPVLCLGADTKSRRLHYIAVDNAQGVQSALRHLLNCGHRRVAFLSHKPDTLDMMERVAAFRQAVGTLGLDASADLLICRDDPGGTRTVVDTAIRRWFSGRRPPTAILSGCHMVTSDLVSVLAEAGIRCPDDVSIVGFDDSPLLSHLATPMTVVRQPLAAMGHRAAQIYRTLAAERPSQPVRAILPVELVVRDSCAPPRTSAPPSRLPATVVAAVGR